MKQVRVVLLSLLTMLLCSLFSTAQQSLTTATGNATVPPLGFRSPASAADEGGNSLSGVVNLTFSLYAAQQGGVPLWIETQSNVQLDATGHYSVQLGISKPNGVPTTLFTSGEARWLGVRIAEQAEQPRVLLLSVPYALKAGDAATIGGLPPSAFVLAGPSGSAPTAAMDASATTQTSGTTTDRRCSHRHRTGTVNFLPLWDTTSDIISSVLFQSGTGATSQDRHQHHHARQHAGRKGHGHHSRHTQLARHRHRDRDQGCQLPTDDSRGFGVQYHIGQSCGANI